MAPANIALAVGAAIEKHKMRKHFDLDITDAKFTFTRKTDAIASEAATDGIYIVRTSLASEVLDEAAAVRSYKSLSQVDIDQAWRLSRISGVAVGLCDRRRPAVPRGRRRSDSLQFDDRFRIGLHQFSATDAGLHHAAA